VDAAQPFGAGLAIHDVPRRFFPPLRIGELGLANHVRQQVAVLQVADVRRAAPRSGSIRP